MRLFCWSCKEFKVNADFGEEGFNVFVVLLLLSLLIMLLLLLLLLLIVVGTDTATDVAVGVIVLNGSASNVLPSEKFIKLKALVLSVFDTTRLVSNKKPGVCKKLVSLQDAKQFTN